MSVSTSESVTSGIRVRVQAEYSPEHSDPRQNHWFFFYTVRISNEGDEPVQLVSRHWVITDASGHIEEVRGLGVVGQQPLLSPGDSFEYTSACPLKTSFGVMEGSYQMVATSGRSFDARIAPFSLSEPSTIH
jgi:ApaG protein